jgi:hypothetical protein
MKKKKESESIKSIKDMIGLGTYMGVSSVALGAFPSNPITPNVTAGMEKVSTAFPAYGKIAGTAFTIEATKGLIKSTKKLKLSKGGLK